MNQNIVFSEGEGDNYYRRNKCRHAVFPSLLKALCSLSAETILEIGCADGYILEALQGKRVGIDPSREAIESGKTLYPELFLEVGTSDELNFVDKTFDLVFMSFVMHWVDREKLFKTVSEIDRVLKVGGHILIFDFYPDIPQKVPYTYAEGLFTYKQRYGDIFSASGLYESIRKNVIPYSGIVSEGMHSQSKEPCAIEILRKR